ncbi:glycosyltransferase [Thermogladius calderae]|uniref:glycosyltransferase n=1 Tax=Thermogladius calderae TaxID=1200300 RepID=UPI001EE641C8|nr:glycosyltransferase [Thermogladius calderae]
MAIVASGGGHTSFAVALVERLLDLEPGLKVEVVAPTNDTYTLRRLASRLRGSGIGVSTLPKPLYPQERLYRVLARAPRALVKASALARDIDALICTGSNHSVPPSLVALARWVPVFCVEDPYRVFEKSRSARLLHMLGAYALLQWEEQLRLYRSRSFYVGLIYEKPVYTPERGGYVLVTTGTMGHRLLFRTIARGGLKGYRLVIQAGKYWAGYLKRRLPGSVVFDYDPDIDKWIAGADLVITHQGVAAIQASQAYGKPVVIAYNPDIPLAGGREGAEFVARKLNLGYLTPDPDDPSQLDRVVEETLSKRPATFGDGAAKASKVILDFIKGVGRRAA